IQKGGSIRDLATHLSDADVDWTIFGKHVQSITCLDLSRLSKSDLQVLSEQASGITPLLGTVRNAKSVEVLAECTWFTGMTKLRVFECLGPPDLQTYLPPLPSGLEVVTIPYLKDIDLRRLLDLPSLQLLFLIHCDD